jgi:hypothetical protein
MKQKKVDSNDEGLLGYIGTCSRRWLCARDRCHRRRVDDGPSRFVQNRFLFLVAFGRWGIF